MKVLRSRPPGGRHIGVTRVAGGFVYGLSEEPAAECTLALFGGKGARARADALTRFPTLEDFIIIREACVLYACLGR